MSLTDEERARSFRRGRAHPYVVFLCQSKRKSHYSFGKIAVVVAEKYLHFNSGIPFSAFPYRAARTAAPLQRLEVSHFVFVQLARAAASESAEAQLAYGGAL